MYTLLVLAWSTLYWAAKKGHFKCLEELLRKNAGIGSMMNNKGSTALLLASEAGNLKCLEELCNEGADVRLQDWRGKTAFDHTKDEPCLPGQAVSDPSSRTNSRLHCRQN